MSMREFQKASGSRELVEDVGGEYIAWTDCADLLELARAFISYLEDDSRSERRRHECLIQAKATVARISEAA